LTPPVRTPPDELVDDPTFSIFNSDFLALNFERKTNDYSHSEVNGQWERGQFYAVPDLGMGGQQQLLLSHD